MIVPELDDCGRWREVGVTHWHFVTEDVAIADRSRYDGERFYRLSVAATEYTADPREALTWIAERRAAVIGRAGESDLMARRAGLTAADWEQRHQVTWWMLTHVGGLAGGGVAISNSRAVEIFAVPMTPRGCSRHARP